MQKIRRVYCIVLLCILLLNTVGCSRVVKTVDVISNGQTTQKTSIVSEPSDTRESSKTTENLVVWSVSDVIATEIEGFESNYNCTVQLKIVDVNGFVPQLMGAIKNSQNVPDVILFESADLHNEQVLPYLLELDEYATELDLKNRQIPYAYDYGKNNEQKLVGVTFDVNPIALYYRRSIAKKVFGTDVPSDIETLFLSYSSIVSMAEKLAKDNVKLFPDLYVFRSFDKLESVDWIDEAGLLSIDKSKYAFLNTLKTLKAETGVAYVTKWSKEWFQGMERPITNAYGEDMQIFAYVLPSWGLNNIIMLAGTRAEQGAVTTDEGATLPTYNQTAGDWAVAAMSNSTFLGGNYLTIYNGSQHIELAKDFLTYMVSDVKHLSTWAKKSHQLFALKEIRGYQGFEEEKAFLGGQDYENAFLNIAEKIEVSTATDMLLAEKERNIEALFQEVILEFIQGGFHTVDEALEFFKKQVMEIYPEIVVEN